MILIFPKRLGLHPIGNGIFLHKKNRFSKYNAAAAAAL